MSADLERPLSKITEDLRQKTKEPRSKASYEAVKQIVKLDQKPDDFIVETPFKILLDESCGKKFIANEYNRAHTSDTEIYRSPYSGNYYPNPDGDLKQSHHSLLPFEIQVAESFELYASMYFSENAIATFAFVDAENLMMDPEQLEQFEAVIFFNHDNEKDNWSSAHFVKVTCEAAEKVKYHIQTIVSAKLAGDGWETNFTHSFSGSKSYDKCNLEGKIAKTHLIRIGKHVEAAENLIRKDFEKQFLPKLKTVTDKTR